MSIPIAVRPGLSILFLAVAASCAAATHAAGVSYQLDPGSRIDTGCFGPCDCAVRSTSMAGTFALSETAPDPLYRHFDLTDVQWKFEDRGGVVQITGSGHYQVGGEFAAMQRMQLDLSIDGQPAKHFDSGLVQGGGTFPFIDVEVPLHMEAQCVDTMLRVVASPQNAGVPHGGGARGLGRAVPNPFRESTQLGLVLQNDAPVTVVIRDAQGRRVRTLLSGPLAAGTHLLRWDGLDDLGVGVRPGVYVITARGAGFEYDRTLTRVH
jgi:hypothetical protein